MTRRWSYQVESVSVSPHLIFVRCYQVETIKWYIIVKSAIVQFAMTSLGAIPLQISGSLFSASLLCNMRRTQDLLSAHNNKNAI